VGLTGLFGGAFDPPHLGHVALARRASEHFDLERLIVIPTGVAPHKEVQTPAVVRCRLAEAAFGDLPQTEVSRWEIDRGEPSYTVETTRWARGQYGDLMFLVGADQFAKLETWHRPDEVLELARLGVATRPGYPRDALDAALARLLDPSRVSFFELEPHAVSSTEVRARAARGESLDGLVPPAVARLVEELGLYRPPSGDTLDEDQKGR
jgi:nicotinate-nucleotide adenylyltransferase